MKNAALRDLIDCKTEGQTVMPTLQTLLANRTALQTSFPK